MIRVVLPAHLRTIAKADGEIHFDLAGAVTIRALLDTLETHYPALRGTVRDPIYHKRRPFVRFFACEEDLSHDSLDAVLPEAVLSGEEPLFIVGAIAGGS